ncbi:MAG: ribulose-phosphate 3-epimerase [Candidatus Wolframiiraptor sp. EX4484-121]|nr:MAG: ribulose-phosphate 3-epimerase [Candidatus Wolframiiraptor sp. EX4484-121]
MRGGEPHPIKIAPSILSADFSRLGEEVRKAEEAGADIIHLDIMDGHFVPNLTFGPIIVKAIRDYTKLPFYVHLMVERPEDYIERVIEAGGDLVIVHVEACTHLQKILSMIRDLGARSGVALNPATPLTTIEYVLDDLDLILIMSVNPGFGGQEFIPSVLPKIRRARRRVVKRGLEMEIAVDGGVNVETAPKVVEAGADVLVAGTAVFGKPNLKKAIQELREAASKPLKYASHSRF